MVLRKYLKPLTVSMAIFGLYHEPRITKSHLSDSRSRRSKACRPYCLLTLVFLWFTLLRYIPSFWVGFDFHEELLVDRVNHLIWFAQCALNATLLFLCFDNPNHMSEFLRLWDKLHENNFAVSAELPDSSPLSSDCRLCRSGTSTKPRSVEHQIKAIVWQNVAWIWIFVVFNLGLVAMFLFAGLKLKQDMGLIICAPFPATVPVEVFFLVLHIYTTCAWIFPLGFGNALCAIMQARFSDLTQAIQQAMERGQDVASLDPNKIKSETVVHTADSHYLKCRTAWDEPHTDVMKNGSQSYEEPTNFPGIFCIPVQIEPPSPNAQVDSGHFLQKVEYFRRIHLQLCSCVCVLDRTMGRLLMATYVTTIPLLCFMLYELISSSLEPFTIGIYCFWTGVNVLQTVRISISAARVNEEAHSPLELLYFADVTCGTPLQREQLKLFLSKLTGTSVGFTALGIVTVRKEMLFTLAGLLVTYFFLLLQYKIN